MKEMQIIALLERISSEKEVSLSPEEDIRFMEAFSQIPLLDEKLDEISLYDMETKLFSNPDIKQTKKRLIYILWRPIIAVAALVALVFSCGLWIKSMDVTYTSVNKEHLSFVLPDKSEVTLNNNSSASFNKFFYHFSKKVQMNGEAYFVVTKGQKFTVETRTHNITVLGTRFTVFEKDTFDVICYEGKVMVESKDGHEKKTLTKGRTFSSKGVIKEEEPEWIKGEHIFENAQLVNVLKQIEKIYKISIENKELCDGLLFTGAFPTDNLSIALKVVLAPYNITYEQSQSGYVLKKTN